MNLRILHTGDLHIGSFPGPERAGENARFQDICRCLQALVEEAEKQMPDIAIVAGDVFHQAKVWSDRGLREQQTAVQFIRKLEAICPVVVMRGTPNHDSEEQFKTLKSTFAGDDRVHIVTDASVGEYTSNQGKIQIACMPGFDKGYFRTMHPGLSKEEENVIFTEDARRKILELKSQCSDDIPSVLVAHYTVIGCNMESGQNAFFNKSEPVLSPDNLEEADFDLVCLGHIHRPQQISGCRNTFYCGAVSGLNFNDEGQKRGFWIHEIQDNQMVSSKFHELPSRKFLTIFLDDADIVAINEGRIFSIPHLNDKEMIQKRIVRVLYNTTSEHNKAFSHAILEKYLMEKMDAFWVQNIAPQKISTSIDKKSLSSDESEESNLFKYLTENDYSQLKIAELMDLARPIINEATEKATVEHHNGLFVPVEIEVKNYRNYREEKFSFRDVEFCAINGDNGVGKSSLFMDAMIDALYEEPREGSLTGWICNAPDVKSGGIKFIFLLGDKLYRVTRTRLRSGKATLSLSECIDGTWFDRSKEKMKDTQQEIINIIGMDSLTLKACALIMQDQYGLFLQADKESRMNILSNLLGLGIYYKMEAQVATMITDLNRDIRANKTKIETLSSDLPSEEKLITQIKEVMDNKKDTDSQLKSNMHEREQTKLILNGKLEAADHVLSLSQKIHSLKKQMNEKESSLVKQQQVFQKAKEILENKEVIMNGVSSYHMLLEKEKMLIEKKVVYDNLLQEKKNLEDSIADYNDTMAEYEVKIENTGKEIQDIQKILDSSGDLEAAHSEYSHVKLQITEMENIFQKWRNLTQAVLDAKEHLHSVDKEYEAENTRISLECQSLRNRVELLKDSGCPHVEKASCRFLSDAIMAQSELPKKDLELKELQKTYEKNHKDAMQVLDSAKKILEECPYHPDTLDSLKLSLQDLEAKENRYRELDKKKSEMVFLHERCDEFAKNKKIAFDKVQKANDELLEVMKKISLLKDVHAEYLIIQEQITKERKWIDEEKNLSVAKEQITTSGTRISELLTEIDSVNRELDELNKTLQSETEKTKGTEELRSVLSGLDDKIEVLQNTSEQYSLELGGLQKQQMQMVERQKQISALRANMETLSERMTGYEELKKAFSQDGIPHNIIRSVIPVFEETATNILSQMSQGHMSVELVTERVLKSNKKEVTALDIIINDEATGRLPYMSRSGGEKVKAALSVILALSEIKSSKARVQLGFLFIDEPPFLDSHGAQAYCDALEAIQKRYPDIKIMAITHDPLMKSRFPQSVDVVKTSFGSKLICD